MPMSPSPHAPRIASQTACSSTSASECPARPRSNGMVTPPSTSRRPGTSAWTSKPVPTRTVPMVSRRPCAGGQYRLGQRNVFGIGHLDVGGAALHQPRLDAERLDRLRLVEELRDIGPPQRVVEDRIAEHLRRLRAPQPVPRLGRGRAQPGADLGALQRVAQRHGEKSADRLVLELVQQPVQRRHVDTGAHRVVHQYPVFGRRPLADRSQAVPHRFAARGTALVHRDDAGYRSDPLGEVLVATRQHDKDRLEHDRAVERRDRMREQRQAGDRCVLLRQPAAEADARCPRRRSAR